MRTFAEAVVSGPSSRDPAPYSAHGSHVAEHVPTSMLVRALQRDLIPRLAQAHRPAPARLTPQDVEAFTAEVLDGLEDALLMRLEGLRQRGFNDETLCTDLLAPAARLLGRYWDDDRCDFTAVTIGVGRLQRLLRLVGPGRTPPDGADPQPLSVMLLLPPQEQHSFGLSMLADFFRSAGWQVSGGVGDQSHHPGAPLRQRHFDAVGISCGGHGQLPWLKKQIPLLRQASRNPRLVVMVGGPLFSNQPETLQGLGADLCVHSAREAPGLAERLVRDARRHDAQSPGDWPAHAQAATG